MSHGNFAEIIQGHYPDGTIVSGEVAVYPGMADDYHLQYERRRQPDLAGAHAFAYTSIGLIQQNPVGAGFIVPEPCVPRICSPAATQTGVAVVVTGYPTFTGGIYSQPLLDARGGQLDSIAAQPYAPATEYNGAWVQEAQPLARNDPFPYGG